MCAGKIKGRKDGEGVEESGGGGREKKDRSELSKPLPDDGSALADRRDGALDGCRDLLLCALCVLPEREGRGGGPARSLDLLLDGRRRQRVRAVFLSLRGG